MLKLIRLLPLLAFGLLLNACAVVDRAGSVLSYTPPIEVKYDAPTNSAYQLVDKPQGKEHWHTVEEVRDLLTALGPEIDDREADMLARAAVFFPMQLAADYQLTRPPILHNYRVNDGRRPRGLCIHWAEDMILEFAKLQLKTIELHWGVANLDKTWPIEHSCVVATAPGQPFEEGVVLDGWRNSGKLYFGPVQDDKYAWQELFNQVTDEVRAIVAGEPLPPRNPDDIHTMSHNAKERLVETTADSCGSC